MKYLVFGVNGMAGHMIATYLLEHNQQVRGFAREDKKICEMYIGDAVDTSRVQFAIRDYRPDCVINAVGVLNKHVDEHPRDGIFLNAVFPHVIADLIGKTETKLIHISTDCVFEGTKGNYTEDCQCDALSCYGKSKALGEVDDSKNLTIRTSIIGPEIKENGEGLFHWFMKQEDSVYGYTNVWWSGVTTLQLAECILRDQEIDKRGLYHLVNNKKICKYDLLILFNEFFRNNKIKIEKNDTIVSDKSLINSDISATFPVPDYADMIDELAKWINLHKEMYHQYFE